MYDARDQNSGHQSFVGMVSGGESFLGGYTDV